MLARIMINVGHGGSEAIPLFFSLYEIRSKAISILGAFLIRLISVFVWNAFRTTNYQLPFVDLSKGYSYSRSRNPTVEALANKVNKMEGGEGATMFGTGMAATVTVIFPLHTS